MKFTIVPREDPAIDIGLKLLTGTLWLTLAATVAYPGDKIFLATHDQRPLTYLDSDGVLKGAAVNPVEFALRTVGIPWEVEILPWLRAQETVKAGRCDGFFAASRNQDRDSYATATEPIATQTTNWYLLKTNPRDPRAKNFKTTARVAGYAGSNMLKSLKDEGYLVTGEPADPDQLFLMLGAHRFDACLANDNNYTDFLEAHPEFDGRFKIIENTTEPLFLYISNKFLSRHPKFLALFNAALKEYKTLKH